MRPLLEECVREVLAGAMQPEDLEPADAHRRALAFKSLIAHLNTYRARLKAQAAKVVPESQRLLPPPATTNGSRLLTVPEAAALLRTTPQAIYAKSRRADWKPFTTKPGRHLLFDEAALRRWQARQSR